MSQTVRCAFCFVVVFACGGDLFAAEHGAKQLDQAFLKALKAGDVDAVVKLYHPTAIFFPPGESELRGQEPIRFRWNSLLSRNTITEGHLEDVTYETSGSLSAGWGRVSLTLVPKAGGKTVMIRGKFSSVAVRKNRKWLYVSMMVANLREPLTLKRYATTPPEKRP
jgi:ketosteroid isomerase-like protein